MGFLGISCRYALGRKHKDFFFHSFTGMHLGKEVRGVFWGRSAGILRVEWCPPGIKK